MFLILHSSAAPLHQQIFSFSREDIYGWMVALGSLVSLASVFSFDPLLVYPTAAAAAQGSPVDRFCGRAGVGLVVAVRIVLDRVLVGILFPTGLVWSWDVYVRPLEPPRDL